MAFFKNKEEKEIKKQEKLDELMKRYNLEDLSPKDKESVKLISMGLAGTGLIHLTSSKAEDVAKLSLLEALVDQNWIIIKLLNEINEKLDK